MQENGIGPTVHREPEKAPEGRSFLDRAFAESNRFVRSCIGYGNRSIEEDCGSSEIFVATLRGYAFCAVPIFTGAVATVATDALAGGGFNAFRCLACFAAAGSMAVADSVILHSRIYRRGIRDLRDGGAFVKLPSDADRGPARIIGFRVAQSAAFGLLVAGALGLALNASAIDARLDENNLVRNHVLVDQAVTDYNAELSRAEAAYDNQRALVDRLTKLQRRPARVPRRKNLSGLDSRVERESQKLEQDKTALDQFQTSRPEFIRHTLQASPTYIPISTAPISKLTALGEEFWDHPFSAVETLLIDGLIVGIDTLSLCLGGIGIGGALYPARSARRRLEQLTEEARAVAKLAAAPETPTATAAEVVALNGAALRRGPGRPRKDQSQPPATKEPGDE